VVVKLKRDYSIHLVTQKKIYTESQFRTQLATQDLTQIHIVFPIQIIQPYHTAAESRIAYRVQKVAMLPDVQKGAAILAKMKGYLSANTFFR
jgi:hypothetical protein